MCGLGITQGVHQKNIIKKATFNDYQYLKYDSDFLCQPCAALISDIRFADDVKDQKRRLRSFSFLATENGFKVLKREDIWETIFTPPAGPFVFCVTYSNKKHIAFKTRIQCDSQNYVVYTDKGEVLLELAKITELARIISCWYKILPGKQNIKQQPTFFTKSEILHGGYNFRNISEYGIERYNIENRFLEKYRNTTLLTLLVFALNKTIDSNIVANTMPNSDIDENDNNVVIKEDKDGILSF